MSDNLNRKQQLIDGMIQHAKQLEKDGLLDDGLLQQINERIANLCAGSEMRKIVLVRERKSQNRLLIPTDLHPDSDKRLSDLERAIYNYLLRIEEKPIGPLTLLQKLQILVPELETTKENMVERAIAKLYRITQYSPRRVVWLKHGFFKMTSQGDIQK